MDGWIGWMDGWKSLAYAAKKDKDKVAKAAEVIKVGKGALVA